MQKKRKSLEVENTILDCANENCSETVRKLFATERGKQNRTGILTSLVYKGVSALSND